jgi:hypothetical protein
MHFGENQLSRSLIGLSPLTTGHPPTFQRWWVRPSTRSYPRFSLPMARSPRFGSRTHDYTPSSDSLSLRLPHNRLTSPHATNSQAHSSKGTPSPHTPKRAIKLRRIVGTRFQVLFHSPPGVLFTFPSRYSCTIGHQEVFRLTRWSWQIHGRFQESAATRERPQRGLKLSPTGLSPPTVPLSSELRLTPNLITPPPDVSPVKEAPHNPDHATPDRYHTQPV